MPLQWRASELDYLQELVNKTTDAGEVIRLYNQRFPDRQRSGRSLSEQLGYKHMRAGVSMDKDMQRKLDRAGRRAAREHRLTLAFHDSKIERRLAAAVHDLRSEAPEHLDSEEFDRDGWIAELLKSLAGLYEAHEVPHGAVWDDTNSDYWPRKPRKTVRK